MEKQKKRIMKWVKTHKKELVNAGISIAAVIAAVIAYVKREDIIDLWDTLKKAISNEPATKLVAVNAEKRVETATPSLVNTVEIVTETSEKAQRMSPQSSIEVSSHIRNLPEGCHASAEKIASAVEHGYHLLDGQTWVDEYSKRPAA